ncbi:hypothetical protein [Mycoplasmopsis cynos]|uniref:Helix-turn-helix type 11 domain-containing protein n=3 Tax=Mycoplasmopsis cynos TaxID=171284 RepID=L0RUZ4_MYCC1|nr:hypothetical protein [Mycoplasmopsis cynos]MCU9936846.1 hypothetical protein [Mycoplasmopsis cynos]WQQ17710.1 hypothetical protein RRG56_00110 [Mycoplasmopsis cynos]CCP23797.1 Hypothetical protein MCYN_0065 [Mycoplasmopsis cynos C142]VEU64404.1 Uncharacterised protein [Mycoplasmopsis cynos]
MTMTKFEKKRTKFLTFISENLNHTNLYISKKLKISTRTVTRYRKLLRENDYKILKEHIMHGNKEAE